MKSVVSSMLVVLPLLGLAQAQQPLRVMAPCTEGCSYEVLAQALSDVLAQEGLARVTVYNAPGLAGVGQFVQQQAGNGGELMVVGYTLVGSAIALKSPIKLSDFTPVARLTVDYETLIVPANSPYQNLGDLIRAFKARPEAVTWGGSTPGGTAHVLAGLIARAADVDVAKIRFVPSAGAVQAARAMLQGQISVVAAQYAAVEDLVKAGQVRVLGISAPRREPGLDIPTLEEQGLDVEFSNWRGVVAPPGISTQDQARLQLMFSQLARTERWQRVLRENNWTPYFQTGISFRLFIQRQEESLGVTLRSLGLLK